MDRGWIEVPISIWSCRGHNDFILFKLSQPHLASTVYKHCYICVSLCSINSRNTRLHSLNCFAPMSIGFSVLLDNYLCLSCNEWLMIDLFHHIEMDNTFMRPIIINTNFRKEVKLLTHVFVLMRKNIWKSYDCRLLNTYKYSWI